MPTGRGELSEELGLLYEGLAFPERWPDFLTEKARRFGCDKAAIIFHDWEKQKATMGFYVGVSEEAMREYNAYYGAKNPIAPLILQAAQRNVCWHGLAREVVRENEYKKSEFYDGWGRKHGVFHAAVGYGSKTRTTGTSLSVCRPERRGPLDQNAVDMMGLIVPHLRRAFQIYTTLDVLRSSAEVAHATLEKFGTAVIAISGDGSVVSLNRQAEVLLERSDGLTLRQGRLQAVEPSQVEQWEQLLNSAALTGAGRGTALGGAMLLHRCRASQPLRVMVMPFHSSHLLTEEHPCALVFINDPEERPPSRAAFLSTLYRLTPAECRLADLILDETDLHRVSERMRITMNTARFMLKSILRKTETHRQSQLVRLLMTLPGEAQR
jgi:DNA-binding CsgD family transcriptional regulator